MSANDIVSFIAALILVILLTKFTFYLTKDCLNNKIY